MSNARGIVTSLCIAAMLAVPAQTAAQDTHDIEFHALFPAFDDGDLFSCLPAGTMYDPLRAGNALQLKDNTGDNVGFGILEHVPLSSMEGMCETMATFVQVRDAPVYFVLAGDQAIATRERDDLIALDWVTTAVFGAPIEPTASPTPAPSAEAVSTRRALITSDSDPTLTYSLDPGRYRLEWRTNGCERVVLRMVQVDGDFRYRKVSKSSYATATVDDVPEGAFTFEQRRGECKDWSARLDWMGD